MLCQPQGNKNKQKQKQQQKQTQKQKQAQKQKQKQKQKQQQQKQKKLDRRQQQSKAAKQRKNPADPKQVFLAINANATTCIHFSQNLAWISTTLTLNRWNCFLICRNSRATNMLHKPVSAFQRSDAIFFVTTHSACVKRIRIRFACRMSPSTQQ